MSPTKTSADGCYRFDRVFRGLGRLQVSSGARTLREYHRRDALLTKLYEQGRLDLLRGLKRRDLSITELLDADRRDVLATARADHLALRRPLWQAAEASLAAQSSNVDRYRDSLAALRRSGILLDTATVGQLADVDWRALEAAWGHSAADWNHLRRMISRVLTLLLEGAHHPFRHQVLRDFPLRRETGREPDLTPAAFHVALAALEPPFRPFVWVLAATGMRPGELWQGQPDDLMPLTMAYRIHRRVKNRTSVRSIELDANVYAVLASCLPATVKQDRVLRAWGRACATVGIAHLTLHDLRHCFAQWAMDAGVSEADLQRQLGHLTPAMTRRYQMRKQRRRVTEVVAGVLGAPQFVPQPVVRKDTKRGA